MDNSQVTDVAPLQTPPLSLLKRIRNRLFHLWFLVRRPMTLGVRAIVLDEDRGSVLLVRHTYVSGWHLPGGGVDPGETCEQAIIRELAEETNTEIIGKPQLVSVHFNRVASRRDHVLLYRVEKFRQTAEKTPDREIAEAAFFSLDDLPADISPRSRRRIAEVLGNLEQDQYW